MTDTPDNSPEILARRAEKQWRHEDRELTTTHALWATLAGLQGLIAAIAGVLAGQNSTFSSTAFICIGSLSLLSIVILTILNYLSRAGDRSRAEYFKVTSQPQDRWPESFHKDLAKEDERSRVATNHYLFCLKIFEPLVIVLFIINAIIFGFTILK